MADTRLDKRVRLSGALPGEDRENGLDYLASRLADDPEGSMVLAVVILDVRSVTHDIVSDAYVPLLRIREIEAVMRDAAPDHVVEYMAALRDQRRGEQAQLFDEELPDHLDDEEQARLDDTVAVVPADADVTLLDPFRGRAR